jgi:hypothetical protein
MEVCYWALLFMPLVILHHLLNVYVQLANERGFKQKKMIGRSDGHRHKHSSKKGKHSACSGYAVSTEITSH